MIDERFNTEFCQEKPVWFDGLKVHGGRYQDWRRLLCIFSSFLEGSVYLYIITIILMFTIYHTFNEERYVNKKPQS